jgi:hypothetical protein
VFRMALVCHFPSQICFHTPATADSIFWTASARRGALNTAWTAVYPLVRLAAVFIHDWVLAACCARRIRRVDVWDSECDSAAILWIIDRSRSRIDCIARARSIFQASIASRSMTSPNLYHIASHLTKHANARMSTILPDSSAQRLRCLRAPLSAWRLSLPFPVAIGLSPFNHNGHGLLTVLSAFLSYAYSSTTRCHCGRNSSSG